MLIYDAYITFTQTRHWPQVQSITFDCPKIQPSNIW